MSKLLYYFVDNPLSSALVAVWFVICIASQRKLLRLGSVLSALVERPIIFTQDPMVYNIPFYPRSLFEQMAKAASVALNRPLGGVIARMRELRDAQVRLLSHSKKPLILSGYFLFLALLLLFLYADAISVVTTLSTLGVLAYTPPPYLARYEIMIMVGSFLSMITGILVLGQISAESSELSDWDSVGSAWRALARMLAIVTMILGFLIILALAIQRLVSLGFVNQVGASTAEIASLVVVPINVALSSALVFGDGVKGLLVLLILLQGVLLIVFESINYIMYVLGWLVPVVVDIVYRLILLLLAVLFYILTTPILLFTSLIASPFGWRESDSEIAEYEVRKHKT